MQDSKVKALDDKSVELLRKMRNCVDLGTFIQKAEYVLEAKSRFKDEVKVLERYLDLHERENLNMFDKMKKVAMKRNLVKFFSELNIQPQAEFAV